MDETEVTAKEEVDTTPARTAPKGSPSNPVYARVGDEIKLAAHEGVQRGLTPQEIIQGIMREHKVHLNVGELRLLLAGRREPE